MPAEYLHQRKDFPALLRIVENETGILAGLVEKDYWIMQALHGLKKQGFDFELKGGTSLSKGYQIIRRFSEDIDIRINPPPELKVEVYPNKIKPAQIESRRKYYDWLVANIKIEGIISVVRDGAFDDPKYYRSGGIRLLYESKTEAIAGVKEGILLEAGFDTVTPNTHLTISSWALDKAMENTSLEILDNRAVGIKCYHPGYTFVEKLQTIATKFRQEQEDGNERPNYMRQYYDLACLLDNEHVQAFIGTEEYKAHKKERFPKKDLEVPVAENEAFLLSNSALQERFVQRYTRTAGLYYKGQPAFDTLLKKIHANLDRL